MKKLIIVLSLFLLFLPVISAELPLPSIFWRLDTSGDGLTDQAGSNDLNNFGAAFQASCGLSIAGNTGCWEFGDGDTDFMHTTNSTASSQCINRPNQNITWCGWIKLLDDDAGGEEESFINADNLGAGANFRNYFVKPFAGNAQATITLFNSVPTDFLTKSNTDESLGLVDKWVYWCFQYDDDNNLAHIFQNFSEEPYVPTGLQPAVNEINTANFAPLKIGGAWNNVTENLEAQVKWVSLTCDIINTSQMLEQAYSDPFGVTNTSILTNEFNISTKVFASTNFVNVIVESFNIGSESDFVLLNSMTIDKITGVGESIVDYRVLLDNDIVDTGVLRSVDKDTKGVTGVPIQNFTDIASGAHNITLQFRRSIPGSIELSDINLVLIRLQSDLGNLIDSELYNDEFQFSNTNFERNYNFTVNKVVSSKTFFISNFFVQGAIHTSSYYIDHTPDEHRSNIVSRYNPTTNNVGSLSILWIDQDDISTGISNYSIYSNTSTGTINSSFKMIRFDMKDSDENNIGNFVISNNNTNLTNKLTISTATKIANITTCVGFGNDYFIGSFVSLQSTTGNQEVRVILNSSDTGLFIEKTRELIDNDDLGNIFSYGLLGNTSGLNNVTIELWIEPQSELLVYDEGISGYEATFFITTEEALDVSVFINSTLVNNTINFNDPTLPINYSLDLGVGNLFEEFNCSLIVNQAINQEDASVIGSGSFILNISAVEGFQNFNISIGCSNIETESNTGIFIYSIDRLIPRIESSFENDSDESLLATVLFNYNVSDDNLEAVNLTWRFGAEIILKNELTENISGTFFAELDTLQVTNLGIHTVQVEAWDSHNPIVGEHEKYDRLESSDTMLKATFDDGYIELESNDLESIGLISEDNHYKIDLNFKKQDLLKTMYVRSNEKIYYKPNSEHKAHLVFYKQRKYFDLDNEGLTIENVQQFNDYTVLITFRVNSKSLITNSIGDLNYAEKTYTFNVVSGLGGGITDDQIERLSEAIEESPALKRIGLGIEFFAWVILIITFFICGIFFRAFWLWVLSGGIMIIVFILKADIFLLESGALYYKISYMFMLFFGIALAIAGIALQIVYNMKMNTMKQEKDDFFKMIKY